MQLSVNNAQSNPTFGYFTFSKEAKKFLANNIKERYLGELREIVQKEAKNEKVEASINYLFGKLRAYLRTYDEKGLVGDCCRDLGAQGIFSKIFDGTLGYLESVSKASSKMLKKYELSKKIKISIDNITR